MEDPWYYIMASEVSGNEVELGIVAARNGLEAHNFAADHYRKTHNLKTNIHVKTTFIEKSKDAEYADKFYNLLIEFSKEEPNERTE